MNDGNDSYHGLRLFACFVGLFLLLTGVSLFGYVAYFVFHVLNNPEGLSIVEFATSKLKIGDDSLHMSFVYPNEPAKNLEYALKWSESVRFVIFSVVLLVAFSILSKIAASFVSAGSFVFKMCFPVNKKKS